VKHLLDNKKPSRSLQNLKEV